MFNSKNTKMKKLFFLLAVSFVSLLSAKNDLEIFDNSKAIYEISESEKLLPQSDLFKDELINSTALRLFAFPVTFSCGVSYNYEFPSGTSVQQMAMVIAYHDTIWCPF